jgi:hypothetical protein
MGKAVAIGDKADKEETKPTMPGQYFQRFAKFVVLIVIILLIIGTIFLIKMTFLNGKGRIAPLISLLNLFWCF